MPLSFYWHDYETFGTNPQSDRPAQFAGIRTDADFNIIDNPLVIYCKVPLDYLPQPDSCLITGITPQLADQKGVCEAEFIRRILSELSQPNTCTVGYNNLRFDDEVTRNCLYRNFYDPYAREWQNGNSRWDLIDVLRAARALRPKGIQWPVDQEGKPCLRLDQLTIANGIEHESAHDALADVYATLAIAKLVRQAQPKLYQFLFQHRGKAEAFELLQLGKFKPIVHISGRYPTSKNNLAIVLPICKHPTNSNGVIVYDLSINPEALLSLSVADIRQRIFTATVNLPENVERIPLKAVHINKCPVLAPVTVISPADADRLGIDLAQSEKYIQQLKTAIGITEKVAAVFNDPNHLYQGADPDLAIYNGGFFSDGDKRQMTRIRDAKPEQLIDLTLNFTDPRLKEMFFRYKGRNYQEVFTAKEMKKWREFCLNRLTSQEKGVSITFDAYFSKLTELAENKGNIDLIDALIEYADEKMQQLKS